MSVFYKGGYGLWLLFSYVERFWLWDQEQEMKQKGRHSPDHKLQSNPQIPAISSAV